VEKDSYRQSRLCRLLGNPVAFAVVQLLAENKGSSPSEIARTIGRSVQRVRAVLGALCLANEAGDALSLAFGAGKASLF
jgi:predicted transcriptional regulator